MPTRNRSGVCGVRAKQAARWLPSGHFRGLEPAPPPRILEQGAALPLSCCLDPFAWFRLDIASEMGRINASFSTACPDRTLAFRSRDEPKQLHTPHGGLAPRSKPRLTGNYVSICSRPIREQPQIVHGRFGRGPEEGEQLPCALARAPIAKLICATRSTVTQPLRRLPQSGQILQEEATGSLLQLPSFVEGGA